MIRRLEPLTYLVKVGWQLHYVHVHHLLQSERQNSEEGFDDVFPKEQTIPMLSPKLTSGTSTSPSGVTSALEPATESPHTGPKPTPKPVTVQASVLKDKTLNCVSAQPSTPKVQTQTPVSQK